MSLKEEMKKEQEVLDKGCEIFKWSQKLASSIGLWPLGVNYFIFAIYTSYYNIYITLSLIYLYNFVNSFDSLIDYLTVALAILFVYSRSLILCLHKKDLGEIITKVIKDFNTDTFETPAEVKLFMQSINTGKLVLKGLIVLIASTELLWYFTALVSVDSSIDENNQTIFTIPYNIYIFYEINSWRRYYLTYLVLMPTMWAFGCGNVGVDSILISLLFYISAKMSVLTMRINSLENEPDCRKKLNKIIHEHYKLLEMGDDVNNAYSTGLLIYLININFIICILLYLMLVSYMNDQTLELISQLLYLMEMYMMLSIYCKISENLTSESLKCCEAFYNCRWYDLPNDCQKDLSYCIERAQKPLALWAGSFTTFSSVTLTNVTKGAMGYLSVLRNFLIN